MDVRENMRRLVIEPLVSRPLPRGQARVFGQTVILNEEDVHLLSDEQKSFLVELKRSDGLIYFCRGEEDIKAWKEDPEFGNALHLAVTKGVTEPLTKYLCSDKPLSRAYGPLLVAQNSADREYDEDIANAWKEDPKFDNALQVALALEDTSLLKQYLCADKPLSRSNKRELAGYIDLLTERIKSQKRKIGRPRRNAAKADPVEQAVRNAAWMVSFLKKEWCKHHGKERVPGAVLAKMIHEACEAAADTFNVPVKPAKVRSALKTGRIVVA